MSFATLNAGPAISAYWWVAIEGLRKRYGTYDPSWNPADSGMNQHIEPWIAEPPRIGEQRIDPLNGSAEIAQHSVSIMDVGDQITDLFSSAAIGDKAVLTASIPKTGMPDEICVDDHSDLPSSGHLYIDRETFYYTTKDTPVTDSGCESESTGTYTSDSGSYTYMVDSALTENNDFWTGGIIVFTSGPVGVINESRTILRSTGDNPLSWPESQWAAEGGSETANCIYWDPNDPLGDSCSGCNYVLVYPARKIKCSTLAGGTSRYWVGSVVTITDDPENGNNTGEARIVTEWDDTNKVLTLNEPLNSPVMYGADAAVFDIAKYSLSGITRSLYRSKSESHSIRGQMGDYKRIEITTRPTFIKTRRAWIYENRTGGLESEAKIRQGVLSDFSLDASLVSYSISIESIQRLFSQKLMGSPWKGITNSPVWGGALKPITYGDIGNPIAPGRIIGFSPVSDDGDIGGFDYMRVQCSSLDTPPSRGNIRIDNELIHYRSYTKFVQTRPGEVVVSLKLGESSSQELHERDWGQATIAHYEGSAGLPSIDVDGFCVSSRGLFSDKCGRKSIAKWGSSGSYRGTQDMLESTWRVMIPEFMSSHERNAEVRSALVCDGTSFSDIKRIDSIVYTGESGSCSIGDVVVSLYSGATGTINYVDTDAKTIWLIRDEIDTEPIVDFSPNDSLAVGSGPPSWTASVASVAVGDGVSIPAKNNPFNAILALLMSGSTTPQRYNYLPSGYGLGLTEDDVDVDSIELLRDKFFSDSRVDFAIVEPTEFREWSEKLFRSLSVFPYETTGGKLSIGYLMTEAECAEVDDGGLLSIDANVFGASSAPSWNSGRLPITKLNIKYNKNPCKDEYIGEIEVNFCRSSGTEQDYGRSEKIECPHLYLKNSEFEKLSPGSPELPDLVARVVNPLWGRHSMFPAPVIVCAIHYSHDSEVEIGDIVKVTHALLPNLRTGTRGLSDEYFQVTGKAPDIKRGTCTLELWQVGIQDAKYGRCAPSASVSAYAADTPVAGKSTVTLRKRNYWPGVNSPTDPEFFLAGDVVRFLHSNCTPISSPVETAVVYSVGASSIVLTTNLSTAPIDGDIITFPSYDSSESTRRLKFVYLADENNLIGSSDTTPYRFR